MPSLGIAPGDGSAIARAGARAGAKQGSSTGTTMYFVSPIAVVNR